MTALAELRIAGSVEPWQRLGLTVTDGATQVGTVILRFEAPGEGRAGITGWGLAGGPSGAADIDGLATTSVEPADGPAPVHALGATSIDHVVVMTSSLERTCDAIEAATGEPLKRVREAGAVRQGFHRLGEVIVEVVESPQVTSPGAVFWGLVLVVADLHEVCDRLGPDVVALPKPAVQPGRFIATVRGGLGLGAAVALMTP